MSPELTTVLMLLSLFILLAGFPLAFGIGTMGLLFGYLTGGNAFLYMIPQRVINGTLSEYILAAVPLFIFMGAMMGSSGVAERAFTVLQRWMAGLKGGLAVATITLAMMFAACVGVVGASETAIGLLAIPSMRNARYSNGVGQRRGLRRRHPGNPDPAQRHAHPVCPDGRGIRGGHVCGRIHSGHTPGTFLYCLRHHSNHDLPRDGTQPAQGDEPEILLQGIPCSGRQISVSAAGPGIPRSGIPLLGGGLAHRGRCFGIHRRHRHGAYLPHHHLDVLQRKLLPDAAHHRHDHLHRHRFQHIHGGLS